MNEKKFLKIKEIVIKIMKDVFCEIPFGIDHTKKVLRNAENLMLKDNVNKEERQIIILASLLHDIGAVEALRKYGSMDGCYQEAEGPVIAEKLLEDLDLCNSMIERVCYIIGNHHSADKINGKDFKIVWEADQMEQV